MPNESREPIPADKRRVSLQAAVILHRRDYRETSLLLDAFSAEQGRLSLLAKGAKRGRDASSHILRAFIPLRLSWTGQGELPVLTAVEPGGEAIALVGTALYCGFYMNELLLNLLPPRDPHPEVFQLYLDTLVDLSTTDRHEPILRGFEVALLDLIGYGLCLDREAGCGDPIDPAKTYDYQIEQGPIAVAPGSAEAINGSTLLGLAHGGLDDPDQFRQAKRLMRRVIHHYLDGRGLKSRDLFKPIGKARNA